MKTKQTAIECPDLYLTTFENTWAVIYKGMPVCKNFDGNDAEQRAIAVYDLTCKQLGRKPEFRIPVWDGNIGMFRA